MTKVQEFIKKIQDHSLSVSSLLMEVKVLASKLDQVDFLSWIELELNGYKDSSAYPDYRNMPGQVKAWNPYQGWVPVLFKKSDIERTISSRRANQSISEIEELISNKSDSYEMPYSASSANEILKDSPVKTKVSLFIDRSALVGILNVVRNNLLDWAIKLEKQDVQGEGAEFTLEEKEKAQNIESKFNIGSIENFHGNIGENSGSAGKILSPKESFSSKFFWYGVVALVVVILGNIISAIFINHFWGII
ncbi:hypothetical protein COB64_00675 [Candidatus Wolfebacteria bacterium]|nr:MAG: hypothetical protein COB64_00675 [Candidatus Wolfebacteria bacterium]